MLKKRLAVDTLTRSGETFSLEGVVSFSVYNIGNTDAEIGYNGRGILMTIDKGTGRNFPGDSGYVWEDTMAIRFKGTDSGTVQVIKSLINSTEI